jgi:LuxR family maltose regulon positive regulatory protein
MPVPALAPALVLPVAIDGKWEPAFERRLVAVSAPAGYGKTQAMASLWQQACQRGWQALWLPLHTPHSDPAVLLRSLSELLDQPAPALSETPGAAMLRLLQTLGPRTMLLIDDFQLVQDPSVHASVALWLDSAPSKTVLALASRGSLPLRLSRLRLMQQVYELDAEDLSLSSEETGRLAQLHGINLLPEQVASLHAASEGWPAGLQLACAALAKGADAARLSQNFSGGDRDVGAYFHDIVLPGTPAALLELLGRAALFERFSVEFCRDVLNVPDAAYALEKASTLGLFLMPLDRRGQWYRLHPMFAGFLRQHQQRSANDEAQALYCAASRWCERQGMTGEAISHAFHAGEMPLALDLIRRHAERALGLSGQGGADELSVWVRSLPLARMDNTLALRVPYAWSLLLDGRLEDAAAELPLLKSAMANAGLSEPEALLRVGQLLRCALLALGGRTRLAGEAAADWLARWQRGASPLEVGVALLADGYSALMDDAPLRAGASLDQACLQFQRAGSSTGMAIAAGLEAVASLETGEGAHGASLLVSVREQMPSRPRVDGAAALALAEAHYAYEENRLGEAQRLLEGLPQRAASSEQLLQAALLRAGTAQAQRRGDEAQHILCEAVAAAERLGQRRAVVLLQAKRIELLLREGHADAARVEAAQRLAPAAGIAADGVTVVAAGLSGSDALALRICAMRLLAARGQHSRAQLLLRDLLKESRAQGHQRLSVKLLCARAALLSAHGGHSEENESMRVLLEALSLGATAGLCRTLADEGKPLADMVADLVARHPMAATGNDVPPAWLEQLLVACDGAGGAGMDGPDAVSGASVAGMAGVASQVGRLDALAGLTGARLAPTDCALSGREVQVLRLVEVGLRNAEMASQLFLSEMTVKWHLRNIYTKLRVRNRTGALARAREMRLL